MAYFQLANQVHDIYRTSHIRDMDGGEIAQQYADYTASQFNNAYHAGDIQPLFIAARNEEHDLPATLLAAARGGELVPVVLNNRSTDRTAEVARRMGAIVIEVPTGNKMAATQAGFEFARNEGLQNLYFTDGDTLVVPRWGGAMRQRLERADEGSGAAVFGNSILWHGESRVADIVLTGAKLAREFKRRATGGAIIARGHNYAVRLDSDGRAIKAVNSLSPDLFVWDDAAIRDALEEADIPLTPTTSLDTMVITRNDRVPSLRERFSRSYIHRRTDDYAAAYGDRVDDMA